MFTSASAEASRWGAATAGSLNASRWSATPAETHSPSGEQISSAGQTGLHSETQSECRQVKPLRQAGSQLFTGSIDRAAGAGPVGASGCADTQPPSALHNNPSPHAGEQTGMHSPR